VSDNFIYFVPADTNAQPTPEAADHAEYLLTSYAPSDKVEATFEDQIVFYHPVENWHGVKCPACHADLEAWWDLENDRIFKTATSDLAVTTPCCGLHTDLNDLDYVITVAYGRFAIEVMNFEHGDTTPEQDHQISECLGLPIRKVHMRL
jgi:hypothetical protein